MVNPTQLIWLLFGSIAGLLLVYLVHTRRARAFKTLAIGLFIAAMFYVGFALVWGDSTWIAIEVAGVILYSIFYGLSIRFSYIWLGVGWLLHPLWDVLLHLNGVGHSVAPQWYVYACISFDLIVAIYIFVVHKHWSDSD